VSVLLRPIVRRISSRYIAGDTLGDAVREVRVLNSDGCAATVDILGEDIKDELRITEKVRAYKAIVDALDMHSLDAGVSARPTSLGLALSEQVCRANLEEIVIYAGEKGRFVEVAMEDSPYTSVTLDMVIDLHKRHDNVGW
jgi:proline dehydrogenase